MSRRAQHVDHTRRRIVEATVRLHGTLGPAATTVSAIAAEAGVTRLTVYRHFPDDDELFAGCIGYWQQLVGPPDPAAWERIAEPRVRLCTALADLYAFYRRGQDMLRLGERDVEAIPARHREAQAAAAEAIVSVLLRPFRVRGARRRRTATALRHATAFRTWDSLCGTGDLRDEEVIDLMAVVVMQVAGRPMQGTH